MPLNIDFQQILLHMLNFVILFAGLSLLLYTPVRRFLQKRRDTIASKEAELAAREKEQNAVLEHAAALEQQAKDKAAALCSANSRRREERCGCYPFKLTGRGSTHTR